MPLSTVGGATWPESVGTETPLASWGVHVWVLSSHQLPPKQSASTLQPPSASHLPLALHAVERHTTPPLAAVQGPSPSA